MACITTASLISAQTWMHSIICEAFKTQRYGNTNAQGHTAKNSDFTALLGAQALGVLEACVILRYIQCWEPCSLPETSEFLNRFGFTVTYYRTLRKQSIQFTPLTNGFHFWIPFSVLPIISTFFQITEFIEFYFLPFAISNVTVPCHLCFV